MTTYIYADHAATTPLHPAAIAALSAYLQSPHPQNPSSQHQMGMTAAHILSDARVSLLQNLTGQSHPWQLTFTSGGTESIALAIWSLLHLCLPYPHKRRVILSPLEHPAVREAVHSFCPLFGFTVEECAVTWSGTVDLTDFAGRMGQDVAFAAVMTVQNETGVVQPVETLATWIHQCGGLFFTDGVQAAGHMLLPGFSANLPPDNAALPDMLAVSAHKFGGLPGVGALCHRLPLTPVQKGGGQENGCRGGTENIPGIVAMAAAASGWHEARVGLETLGQVNRRCEADFLDRMRAYRIPVTIAGASSRRIPTTSLVVFRDVPGTTLPLGENIVLSADMAGLAVSAGSACHSYTPEPSRTLLSMGFRETEARRAVRLSFGLSNTSEDVENAWLVLAQVVKMLFPA